MSRIPRPGGTPEELPNSGGLSSGDPRAAEISVKQMRGRRDRRIRLPQQSKAAGWNFLTADR